MERKKLKEAVKLVNSVIAEEGPKLRKIIEGDEDSHVMVDGENGDWLLLSNSSRR